ncbi:hypothetical protein TAM4_2447 [Thermococcus sp. AM4]|nr:hypothetical protein TAM4_2447 [Thermococcus sp. AM4]
MWKVSIAVLAPLAFLETEPSTVSIPPLIYHYIITALWIKHDLPRITGESAQPEESMERKDWILNA